MRHADPECKNWNMSNDGLCPVCIDSPCEHNEGYGCENPELHDPHLRSKRIIHNVVAHPLLIIWPRVGEWLHEHTIPEALGIKESNER